MADCRVSGQRLHHVHRTLGWPAGERSLYTSVLVAERDLQVEDLFPMALEAKMSRLNDASVDGADSHLVNLFSFNAVEIHDADDRHLAHLPAPRIMTRPIGSME